MFILSGNDMFNKYPKPSMSDGKVEDTLCEPTSHPKTLGSKVPGL